MCQVWKRQKKSLTNSGGKQNELQGLPSVILLEGNSKEKALPSD
jgi:hypothetical protein